MDQVDLPFVDVLKVRPLEGYALWVLFTDEREGTIDLSSVVQGSGPMVRPLHDPKFFSRVFIESGVPTWPNGYDLDAIALYLDMDAAGLLTGKRAA